MTLLFGLICLVAGVAGGVWLAPQLGSTEPSHLIMTLASTVPGAKFISQADDNSPFEVYNYPIIKWRAKPIADAQGAIAQLWTTYEAADAQNQSGKLNYRLTVFKAPDKHQFEVQLLDETGFKRMQFDATDFHQIPGTADIMEARDSQPCTEAEYKKVRDYSIK